MRGLGLVLPLILGLGCEPRAEPFAYDVIPAERAADLAATWAFAASFDGTWDLRARAVERAERALTASLDPDLGALADFHRQYAGVVADGQRVVYAYGDAADDLWWYARGDETGRDRGEPLRPTVASRLHGILAWEALLAPATGDVLAFRRVHLADGYTDIADYGRRLAESKQCTSCHAWNAESVPAKDAIAPSLAGLFGAERPLSDGRTVVADSAYLVRSLFEPSAELVAGYPDAMPSYTGLLTDRQVDAILAWLRRLPPRDAADRHRRRDVGVP